MGYEVSAHTGTEGLKKALGKDYHAVILDVMLPEMDGFELLRQLRAESPVPVLMLTSRGDETNRIVGLEMGADDYLPKTFSTRELLLDVVADRNFDVFDRSIDMHISSLRGKLGDTPKNPRFIRTVRGIGYLFIPPLRET